MTNADDDINRLKQADLFGAGFDPATETVTFTLVTFLAFAKAAERCGRYQASGIAQAMAAEYRKFNLEHHATSLEGLAGTLNEYNTAVDAELTPVLQAVVNKKLMQLPAQGNA